MVVSRYRKYMNRRVARLLCGTTKAFILMRELGDLVVESGYNNVAKTMSLGLGCMES
jgi:hypothetical protein